MATEHISEIQNQPAWAEPVAYDVVGLRIVMVNVFFIGQPGVPTGWVLVDAGIGKCAGRIIKAAEERFGPGARPSAIIMTHGHFDHVGALRELAEHWDVPIYAHDLELPYLTGRSDYPPPDPSVGGGALARLSFLYSRRGIDVSEFVHLLPADGTVPHLPGWRTIHTPGHTPGHISLFRDLDRVLIAGDAVITTKQETARWVLTQRQHVRRPPAYFTTDWQQTQESVQEIAALQPGVLATGHGQPMSGEEMHAQLQDLASHFRELGLPPHGRYVAEPATADETGVVRVPPPPESSTPKAAIGLGLLAAGLLVWALQHRRHDDVPVHHKLDTRDFDDITDNARHNGKGNHRDHHAGHAHNGNQVPTSLNGHHAPASLNGTDTTRREALNQAASIVEAAKVTKRPLVIKRAKIEYTEDKTPTQEKVYDVTVSRS